MASQMRPIAGLLFLSQLGLCATARADSGGSVSYKILAIPFPFYNGSFEFGAADPLHACIALVTMRCAAHLCEQNTASGTACRGAARRGQGLTANLLHGYERFMALGHF
jgi:hypothetical protein